MMDRVAEAIDLFREGFRPEPIQAIPPGDLRVLPDHWQRLLADIGVCRRDDGYGRLRVALNSPVSVPAGSILITGPHER